MKYLIPLILIIFLIRYLLKSKKRKPVAPMKPEPEVLKQDPVCGAYVSQQGEFSLRTSEGINYFCSRACMERFKGLKH